ncbi:hypothetical protein PENTCL1PPCAC_15880, partial [Pristionchus entomophagus]
AGMTASKIAAIVPRCTELCPSYEVRFRHDNALLHPLEKDFDVRLVKEYTRPAAGCDHGNPDLLRTPEALLRAVDYLLEVYERDDLPFGLRFSFVEDRLRAVRQDSTITRISGEVALTIFEKQISFAIRSEYRARSERSKAFEAKLHATAAEECFQRWSRLLSETDEATRAEWLAAGPSDLRRQVAAVHCLKRADEQEAIVMAIEHRWIMGRDLFETVFDLLLSYREGNSHRFFRRLSFLPLSSLLRPACVGILPRLRLTALTTMAKAFKAPNIKLPLSVCGAWLGYSHDSTTRFLKVAGVTIEEGDCIVPGKMGVERVEKTDRNEPVLICVDL